MGRSKKAKAFEKMFCEETQVRSYIIVTYYAGSMIEVEVKGTSFEMNADGIFIKRNGAICAYIADPRIVCESATSSIKKDSRE